MKLRDNQVISTQTLWEKMDLDYDAEVERLRFESTFMSEIVASMADLPDVLVPTAVIDSLGAFADPPPKPKRPTRWDFVV